MLKIVRKIPVREIRYDPIKIMLLMFLRLGKNDNMRKNIPIIIRLIDKLISMGKLISKNKVKRKVMFTMI
jgi:hypothetical protein